jgi:hypothetical protein
MEEDTIEDERMDFQKNVLSVAISTSHGFFSLYLSSRLSLFVISPFLSLRVYTFNVIRVNPLQGYSMNTDPRVNFEVNREDSMGIKD